MRKFWRPIVLLVLAVVVVPTVSGSVEAQVGSCATGSAVPDADTNPKLVADCEALLAGRDALAGTAKLNWSVYVPIEAWDGISVEGTPQRVTRLDLSRRELTGSIPRELGSLSDLRELRLSVNQLDGEIPSELGGLFNLAALRLDNNF